MHALASIKSALVSQLYSIRSPEEDSVTLPLRYVPESTVELAEKTSYSEREVRGLYRAFKQECPSGIVYLRQFKQLYGQYFPFGDARPFSGLVFSSLDRDQNGYLTFEQYLVGMSVIARGSPTEKLRWVFNLYDLNANGRISPAELSQVFHAVHALIGKHTTPAPVEFDVKHHVQHLFAKMDLDEDGQITFSEFTDFCLKDPEVARSLTGMFDTSF